MDSPRRDATGATYADIDDLADATGFRPETTIEDGIAKFAAWYRDFYSV